MRGLTYRELLLVLLNLSEDDLDTTAIIWDRDEDEFYPVRTIDRSKKSDSELDKNHFILVI